MFKLKINSKDHFHEEEIVYGSSFCYHSQFPPAMLLMGQFKLGLYGCVRDSKLSQAGLYGALHVEPRWSFRDNVKVLIDSFNWYKANHFNLNAKIKCIQP